MSLLGGIRPPVAALSALLLTLAGFTAFTLGRVEGTGVPEAVMESQRHFAEDGAIALRASLDESVSDLGRITTLSSGGEPVPPDTVLDRVGRIYEKWRGTGIVEIESGDLLAARGESLPLTALDLGSLDEDGGLAPRMVRLDNGETRLLTLALLSWEGVPQQLLITSSSLRFPGVSLGKFRAIAVVDRDGRILSANGIPEPEQVNSDSQRAAIERDEGQLEAFAESAADKSAGEAAVSKEPGSAGYPGVSGSLSGESADGERAVAGYAALAAPVPGEHTDVTRLGLTVVAMTRVPEAVADGAADSAAGDAADRLDPLPGLLAAGALLAVGALVTLLLRWRLQRPLLRLFLESRRLSRGDLRRPVRVPGSGETARIGAALERLRLQLVGASTKGPARPRGLRRTGARTLLALCAALLLAWSVPLLVMLNRADATVSVPQQLVADQRERTDTLTDRVRRSLNEGHADLTSAASLIGASDSSERMADVLEQMLRRHGRYSSLYVLGPDGDVLARAGEEPHRPERGPGAEAPADAPPVTVLNDSGKRPVVAAFADIPESEGTAVVGEFRIDFLNSLLGRPGLGEIRVVDRDLRVIGANSGYRAFESLGSERLDTLARASNVPLGEDKRPAGSLFREDGVEIAAAAPFDGGGPAENLGWTVVSWQSASGLAIPAYELQHRTELAGLLGLTAAAACLGWLHIVVVRPLRVLAAQAEALAAGDRRTVLYPRHHDEVGAVIRSLELIRQQLKAQHRHDGALTGSGRS